MRSGIRSDVDPLRLDSRPNADYPQTMPAIARIRLPTAKEFRSKYYTPEQPVIFTDAIEQWPARRSWSFDHFETALHDKVVPVQWRDDNYAAGGGEGWIAHTNFLTMPFPEFLQKVRAGDSSYYLAQTSLADLSAELAREVGPIPFYPTLLGRLSRLPCTVWIGPAGTAAPLHNDPHHNLFAQVVGRKRFRLFPSSQLANMYLPSTLPNQNNFSPVDIDDPDLERFPLFRDATCYEATVQPGEVLFLPRNWGHSVVSLDDAISLTNWWHPWPTLLAEYRQLFLRRAARSAKKAWAAMRRKPPAAESPPNG